MADISGNGFLAGTDADDAITGGDGNDTLIGNGGNDALNGGSGFDFVAYWSSGSAVGVQLFSGTVNDGFGGTDRLSNIEGVFGSAFDDILLGSNLTDVLAGLPGADTIQGLGGDDGLNGGAGNDQITGGEGNDTVFADGNRADYTVTAISGGFTITDNRANGADNEGTDTVTEVEFFTFANGTASAAQLLDPNAVTPNPGNPPPAGGTPTAGDDSLNGGAGNDRIDALAGNDAVNGGGGNDTLIGGAGNDTLDGGAGFDTAAMGNAGFRGVAVSGGAGNRTVTSAAGTDTLANIEVVQFVDGRMVFDENDVAAQVARLYEAALDRAPDQGGLNGWISLLQAGTPLSALAGGFLASDEFRARFGEGTSNTVFVDQLYGNVLGRTANADERGFWTGHLDRGVSRADVLVGFSESAENKAGTAALVQNGIWDRNENAADVARLYDTVLNRAGDAAGVAGWTALIEGGRLSLAQVADGFTNSDEFRAVYGNLNNRDFVDALYRNSLDRPADAFGVDFFSGLLDRGTARSDVVLAFSQSVEHVALTASRIQSDNPGEYGIVFA